MGPIPLTMADTGSFVRVGSAEEALARSAPNRPRADSVLKIRCMKESGREAHAGCG
jgi:hypothetical protein